jgi:hypothetical protein
MKKWLIWTLVIALPLSIIGLPILLGVLFGGFQSQNQAGDDNICLNYEIGSGIPVNGLSPEASANATLIVQEAMRRGLGKDGAAIAIMAGLTESGLNPGDRGDNHNEPEADWSLGIFQTKLWYQAREAWKKPGGGFYPKNDPASIQRARELALNPQWQVDWFMDRLSGEAPSTRSLRNFKWRTDPQYRDKPWMVAQKIEQSRYTNGSNYRAVWNGQTGYPRPIEIVEEILNSGATADGGAVGDATRFTTLSTPFPDLPVGEDGRFEIPGPILAQTSPSGYPVLRNSNRWLTEIEIPSGSTANVASWSEAAFNDLVTRWIGSRELSLAYPLDEVGTRISGFTPYQRSLGATTDYNSGTALNIRSRTLRNTQGQSPYTAEQGNEINRIMRDMGGVLTWGGPNHPQGPAYFYITPNLGPQNIERWAASATSLGQPPYFVVGDSIANSMRGLLANTLPDSTVDADSGRKTASGISRLRTSLDAKRAKTWIVMLGTNDGNNPTVFRQYIDRVMGLAGNRQVFWVNAYRPASNSLGMPTQNNEVLNEAKRDYQNLNVIDWASRAASAPQWFTGDTMLLHPNADGKQALVDMITAAASGNGTSGLGGISALCGNGNGNVANEDYVIGGDPTGVITTNFLLTLKGGDKAVSRAKSFVGNPPTSCSNKNCVNNCGHLSARAWGRSHSGYDTARIQWWAAVRAGKATFAINPETGQRNPEAYNVPLGGLLYWDTSGDAGHVATYIGDGKLMSNYKGERGDGVYAVPFEGFQGYGPYFGWAEPHWPS